MRHLIYEQEIIQQEYDDINDNNFRDDIFAKTVDRGILYHNYEITFEFKCGIKRNGWTKKTKKK
ncbi:hypothetical protein GGQ84_000986 [Desulfitispora alkaliphila]|uniref:hypothetical protein n=1 Tax=Desulfitispora alkaliphila TaxID=622674 RepID=UPI003D2441E2